MNNRHVREPISLFKRMADRTGFVKTLIALIKFQETMRTEPTDFLRRRLGTIVQTVRWHASPLNDRANLWIIVEETFIRSIHGQFRCVLILPELVLASMMITSDSVSQDTSVTYWIEEGAMIHQKNVSMRQE